MAEIVKGNELMLFISGKSIAYATAHTLTLTSETSQVSTKDHGDFATNIVNRISWEITSENLYSEDYDTLLDAMLAKNPITVVWGHAAAVSAYRPDEAFTHFTPQESGKLTGKAIITSLTANANAGENATFSVTLTGDGAITKA